MSFGMLSTEATKDYQSLNARRKIFWQYPNGAAPLMGFLSMLPDEETDKSEFGWWERRFPVQRTQTVDTGTATFLNGNGSALTDGGTGVTLTADTLYRVNVLSTAEFKPTHVIELRVIEGQASAVYNIQGTVTEINSSTQLTFRPDATYTGIKNTATDQNKKTIAIIGTANQEGGRSGVGIYQYPIKPTNFTQIFRTAFNVTRTALKGGLEYDRSGPYKTMAKENGLRHMIEMEKAFLFSRKHEVLVPDPFTGEVMPEKKTGGIRWFLEEWEKADSIYRGGTGAPAITANSDPDKRIINVAGTLSKADYNAYMGRLFKYTSDKEYSKVCLCGGQYLETVNTIFENQITREAAITNKERTWEFIVHTHRTLRGDIHYKVHPLFDEDPDLANAAMYIDLGAIKYRPLTDSDTKFLKNRQANDVDGRKDEWLTEAGLELAFPERCMFITGVTGAAS